MPSVEVLLNVRGDPMATTNSPARRDDEFPISATGNSEPASILSRARSEDESKPRILASKVL
eukprot:CAMPEP_0198318050 /NCGR_PEP_ID=MMETSP1450-20131203/7436_1 /TAXON_ID=753684 ORGANISM="Madagascaria erythrocladiodes, Strain CCMP3234" /NCGR_SAMPLE_ID=MMETSP1450 /ASSEMBLY_ACC=CAM_ASM_001115 /LENGTH=61 /DNA_ID=CAMNT_0044021315 /DNA_START=112 /DNA_END=293 /DNA_ORIENTATION=+